MSNAAVTRIKILRMRSALSRGGNGLCAAFCAFIAGVKPHVINGKGNGKRH